MQITTLPVYSKLADPDVVRSTFGNRTLPVQLSQHQLETYRALMRDDIDVVINTAMTGDGKSLAAYLPALLDSERGTFGMYPTNELARDQRKQFVDYRSMFGSTLSDGDLWGAKLGHLVEQNPAFERRAEALKKFLLQHQVVLTNPDIFHLMMNYRYESRVFSSQELPRRRRAGRDGACAPPYEQICFRGSIDSTLSIRVCASGEHGAIPQQDRKICDLDKLPTSRL